MGPESARHLAIGLSRAGARVAICGRHIETLERMRSKDPSIRAYQADIVVREQILALKQQLDNDMGGILINNAGLMVQFDIKDGMPDSVRNEVELNLMAPQPYRHLFARAYTAGTFGNYQCHIGLCTLSQ